jgi:hypothetical protein
VSAQDAKLFPACRIPYLCGRISERRDDTAPVRAESGKRRYTIFPVRSVLPLAGWIGAEWGPEQMRADARS